MCEEAKPGGIGAGPVLFLLGACLLVSAFGWVLNLIGIGLGFAALVLVGGVVFLTLRHYHRWLSSARLPAWERIGHVQPQRQVSQRWSPGLPQDQAPAVGNGPQLHINLAGASPEAVAEAMRQIRGGR